MKNARPFIVIILVLLFVWYIRSFRHPKYFPPGLKLPLPLIGDAYLLGKNFSSGFNAKAQQSSTKLLPPVKFLIQL